jgi:hypothetical protein
LGVILYEVLTGRPPFRGGNLLETLEQVRTLQPVPPSRLAVRVPRDLETVCLKCLHKQPQQRYASAQELADDLRRFLQGEPVRARPGRWRGRLRRWSRRWREAGLVLGGAAALGLALLAAQLAVFRPGSDRVAPERERARGNVRVDTRRPAAGSDPRSLRQALGEFAARIKKLLEEEKQDAVTVGEFTGPAGLDAVSGPGIQKVLIEQLEAQKVVVRRRGAELSVKGEYLLVPDDKKDSDDDRDRVVVRLFAVVRNGRGDNLLSLTGDIRNTDDIARLTGATANLRVAPLPVPAESFPDPKALRQQLGWVAARIKQVLEEEKQEAITVGEFTGPVGLAVSGPGIEKILTEQLKALKVVVRKRGADLSVKGEYLIVPDDRKDSDDVRDRVVLRLLAVVRNSRGEVLLRSKSDLRLSPPPGVAILFGCSPGGRAFESARLGGGHGLFCYCVLEGLKGGARNEANEVTWDDLSAFVQSRVPAKAGEVFGGGARQSPQLVGNLPARPVVLLRLRPGVAPSGERAGRPKKPPAFAIVPPRDGKGKRLALLIGVRKYDDPRLPTLKYTEGDMVELAGVLRPAGCEVFLLTDNEGAARADRRPTARNIRNHLNALLARCAKEDVVLLAFSGLGSRQPLEREPGSERAEDFLYPADARVANRETLLSVTALVKDLARSPAGVKLMILDADRSNPAAGR